jgi:UDP-3-O-[3-hydroxymyristoyl] N-acetylglucosamine deacetylase/3-hydroxyacyl-[acyl-carrier-protein] dehydratase
LSRQRTIKSPAEVTGKGLFSGTDSRLRFVPAPADSGVTFVRVDQNPPVRLAARLDNLVKRGRRTSLMNGTVGIETIEHVMSAIYGLELDNLVVELEGDETPSTDGSPMPFVEALTDAGIEDLIADRDVYVVSEPVSVSAGESSLTALPGPDDCLDILYDLDYSGSSVGRQVVAFRLGKDDYTSEIAPSRTFLLEQEAQHFQAQGLGAHLTGRDILVMGEDGPIENELRFANEHARHKVADLIGDLGLLGRHLRGRLVAFRSGHELNHKLVEKLLEQIAAERQRASAPLMDVRKIMRLLPHRYPFLMVDRILELDGDRKAVGIKNVSINEPFFQGHYPGQPIMPGVMILEALAQLAGVLITRRLEHTGKVGFLVSMDRVKIRRPVVPGDQLILEAEALHVRTRTGHCRCRASVGGEIAAEAEIKFMLVDAEPV